MEFPDKSELSPVEWIKVSVCEDATVYHDATIGVPSGLSDEEVYDFLHQDLIQNRIFKEENRTIGYDELNHFDWFREGAENPS
jgi:hypothetical protein